MVNNDLLTLKGVSKFLKKFSIWTLTACERINYTYSRDKKEAQGMRRRSRKENNMKATNFQKVNTNTVHIYSTWHSVPDGYDSTLDVWREFICDDYDLFADDESREEWKKDVRAQVEAAAAKEFPYVMWEKIDIWYYKTYSERKVEF